MKAIILAAGYATRLYPITVNVPKCLLPLGGTTILDVLCDKLERSSEVSEIVIVTNDRFYEQMTCWAATSKRKVDVKIINDGTTSNDNRLGAIGDLRYTLQKASIQDDILMLASDNLFDEDFGPFIRYARSKNAVTISLHDIGDPLKAAGKYGVIELNPDGQVVGLEEKPQKPKSSLIGMGIYYFPKATLGLVDRYLSDPEAKDAPGYYIAWLLKNTPIFGFVFPGLWYDIGDFKALEEADQLLSARRPQS